MYLYRTRSLLKILTKRLGQRRPSGAARARHTKTYIYSRPMISGPEVWTCKFLPQLYSSSSSCIGLAAPIDGELLTYSYASDYLSNISSQLQYSAIILYDLTFFLITANTLYSVIPDRITGTAQDYRLPLSSPPPHSHCVCNYSHLIVTTCLYTSALLSAELGSCLHP